MVKEDIKKILPLQLIHGKTTFGQRASDSLAKLTGSWGFILTFVLFLLLWMAANFYAWVSSWDPYPFILLNLVLSCVAALQAPIILMSQNRQADKDRRKAEYDYKVNRATEREVLLIKEKLDTLNNKLTKLLKK